MRRTRPYGTVDDPVRFAGRDDAGRRETDHVAVGFLAKEALRPEALAHRARAAGVRVRLDRDHQAVTPDLCDPVCALGLKPAQQAPVSSVP